MDTSRFRKPRPGANRPALTRNASGQLRPDKGDSDIGDLWAQQRRIQLSESIEQDRKQAALDRLRQERGLVGLAKLRLRQLERKIRRELFGTASLQPATKSAAKRSKSKPLSMLRKLATAAISLAAPLVQRLKSLPPKTKKRATLLAAVAGLAVAGLLLLARQDNPPASQADAGQAAAAANQQTRPAPQPDALQKGTPSYKTVIPAGKTIEQLGGWTRVSPPDREAVYAYTDTLAGVQIAVSQQPLPDDFKEDPESSVAELASAYKAEQKLGGTSGTVHIGTSAKGPQSVILAKSNLLILIKSDAPIPAAAWTEYINSLR